MRNLDQLRREAEAAARLSEPPSATTPVDVQQLLRELRVRQIALEMQNEELRRARQEAEHARQQYHELFEHAPVCYVILDAGGRILRANRGALALLGGTTNDLVGSFLTRYIDPEDGGAWSAILDGALLGIRQVGEIRVRRGRGEALHLRIECERSGRTSADGVEEPLVLLTAVDITERVKAEEALKESESQYRWLYDSNPVPMLVLDRARWTIQAVNLAAVRTYGFAAWEFVGLRLRSLVASDDRTDIEGRLTRGERGAVPGPCRHRIRSGRTILVELTSHDVTFAGRDAVLLVIENVTERLQLQQSEKLRAIGQLAGGIAHDFNNLLTVILSCAATLEERIPASDPLAVEVEDTVSAGRRAMMLTQRLLAFSRQKPVTRAHVEVDPSVREMVQHILRHTIPENIEFELDLAAGEAWVAIDPTQLEQVLINLVVNARDAMPEGGSLYLRTRVRSSHGRKVVVIEVEDTGVGMAPGVLARIFEPFFTTKEAERGTGLGLATVYAIVEQAGGRIGVDSTPGKGTSFRIELPFAEATSPISRISVRPGAAWNGLHVLVVEDDEAVRASVSRGLARHGCRVLEADGLAQALAHCRQYGDEIGVLVTDVVMPRANGLEVVREVRRSLGEIPVVFVTGHVDESLVPAVVLSDHGVVLRKPFMPDELVRAIQESLGMRSPSPTVPALSP